MPKEATWERTRDRIAITHRIIINGKDDTDDAVERMAQAYATNSRPVIRVHAVAAVKEIYTAHGADITLRTAEVVGKSYYALIDARAGKVEPRKWARKMTAVGVWEEIAELLSARKPKTVDALVASYVRQFTQETV